MGVPGRKPKPKGDSGKSDAPGVDSRSVDMSAPSHLDKYGKEHWSEMLPKLVAQGWHSDLDRGTFTIMCEAWSTYRRCRDQLKGANSLVMEYKTGAKQVSPYWTAMQQAWKQYCTLAEQFGMTPYSRGRSGFQGEGDEEDDSDPMSRVLR